MTIEGPQGQSFQIRGFLRSPDSTFTAFDAPAAPVGTDPCCISPSGTIAGLSSEYDNTSGNYISHGFLRGADGTLTAFDFPSAGVNTGVTSMNPQGAVLGSYNAGNQSRPYWGLRPHDTHGYVRARCGFHAGQIPRDLLEQAVGILPVRGRRHGKDGD